MRGVGKTIKLRARRSKKNTRSKRLSDNHEHLKRKKKNLKEHTPRGRKKKIKKKKKRNKTSKTKEKKVWIKKRFGKYLNLTNEGGAQNPTEKHFRGNV